MIVPIDFPWLLLGSWTQINLINQHFCCNLFYNNSLIQDIESVIMKCMLIHFLSFQAIVSTFHNTSLVLWWFNTTKFPLIRTCNIKMGSYCCNAFWVLSFFISDQVHSQNMQDSFWQSTRCFCVINKHIHSENKRKRPLLCSFFDLAHLLYPWNG